MKEYTSKQIAEGTVKDGHVKLWLSQPGYPPFVALFRNSLNYVLSCDLGAAEWRVWFWMLLHTKPGNQVKMLIKPMADELKMHKRTASGAIQRLRESDLIAGKLGVYMINPAIAFNGGRKLMSSAIAAYEGMQRWSITGTNCVISPSCEPEEASQDIV